MDKRIKVNGVDVIAHSDGTLTKWHHRKKEWIRAKGCLTGKYYKVGRGYYALRINGKLIKVHRVIAQAFLPNWDESLVVDHINGNTEDNRPCNLRVVSSGMNQRLKRVKSKNSTSKYRGVCFNKSKGKWESEIRTLEGRRVYIGTFKEEIKAARAFDLAVINHGLPIEALNFAR